MLPGLTGIARARFFRLPWRRPKAFLSSTSQDLEVWRGRVAEILRDAGLDVTTMAQFPAMARTAATGSTDFVRRCDVLFGIYARRYGTVSSDGRSITELEYSAARESGIPRICFLLRETASWPTTVTEAEPGRTKIEKLKEA